MSEGTFFLVHNEARRRAALCVQQAPDGYQVIVREQRRNLDQNAALHARIDEISKAFKWAGKRWDVETWKRLLTAAWCRATGQQVVVLPALDGMGVDIVFRRTSQLSKRECSDLIEFINAWASQQSDQYVET